MQLRSQAFVVASRIHNRNIHNPQPPRIHHTPILMSPCCDNAHSCPHMLHAGQIRYTSYLSITNVFLTKQMTTKRASTIHQKMWGALCATTGYQSGPPKKVGQPIGVVGIDGEGWRGKSNPCKMGSGSSTMDGGRTQAIGTSMCKHRGYDRTTNAALNDLQCKCKCTVQKHATEFVADLLPYLVV